MNAPHSRCEGNTTHFLKFLWKREWLIVSVAIVKYLYMSLFTCKNTYQVVIWECMKQIQVLDYTLKLLDLKNYSYQVVHVIEKTWYINNPKSIYHGCVGIKNLKIL